MAGFSFPKTLNISVPGEAKFFKFEGLTSAGVFTMISEVVPAGKKWALTQAIVICRRDVKIRLLRNVELIGSIRNGPAESNSYFNWFPSFPAVSGDNIKIEATAPILGVDIEAYLQLTEQNI